MLLEAGSCLLLKCRNRQFDATKQIDKELDADYDSRMFTYTVI